MKLKYIFNWRGFACATVLSLSILGIWYLLEWYQFKELQWNRKCDYVVFVLYFIVLLIVFSLLLAPPKNAEFVGFLRIGNETITEYRCPDCGFGLPDDYSYCPYCGTSVKFEPPEEPKDMITFSRSNNITDLERGAHLQSILPPHLGKIIVDENSIHVLEEENTYERSRLEN